MHQLAAVSQKFGIENLYYPKTRNKIQPAKREGRQETSKNRKSY